MKNEEIVILEKVLALLEYSFPYSDSPLIMQYKLLCDKFRAKNEMEKQHYQDKQEYHRDYTKLWRQEHPEQVKIHQADYRERKRAKKQQRDER